MMRRRMCSEMAFPRSPACSRTRINKDNSSDRGPGGAATEAQYSETGSI